MISILGTLCLESHFRVRVALAFLVRRHRIHKVTKEIEKVKRRYLPVNLGLVRASAAAREGLAGVEGDLALSICYLPPGPASTSVVLSRWWAPSKFDPIQSPMLFFEKGMPIIPPLLPPAGMDLALKHMITFVNKAMRPNRVKFFRTQSPRHFEGGDWNEGGSCQRDQPLSSEEVEEFFSLHNNGTNIEVRLVNEILMKALEQSTFRVLNITRLSEFRADAHPSTTGGKKHDDCMHWCLPGPTDTWNDLLAANLVAIES